MILHLVLIELEPQNCRIKCENLELSRRVIKLMVNHKMIKNLIYFFWRIGVTYKIKYFI